MTTGNKTSVPETPYINNRPRAGASKAFLNRSPLPSSTDAKAHPGSMLGASTTTALPSMDAARPSHALMVLRNLK